MPKRVSFFMTQVQFCEGTKDVTRRLGMANAKPGEIYTGIQKGQGLKKGERQVVFHDFEIVSNRPERVDAIDQADVIREGFPDMTPAEFVDMFCRANGCTPDQVVNRIEFRHLFEWEVTHPDGRAWTGKADTAVQAAALWGSGWGGELVQVRVRRLAPACQEIGEGVDVVLHIRELG